jgi:hypothetical protein
MKIEVSKFPPLIGREKHRITDWSLNSKPVIDLEKVLAPADKLVVEYSGGGIKGIMFVYLNYVLYTSGRNLEIAIDRLREVWGCSTGAISAAMWVLGIAKYKNPANVRLRDVDPLWTTFKTTLQWYVEECTKVFDRNFLSGGLWGPIYDAKPIEAMLQKNFGGMTMSELFALTGVTLNLRVVNVTDNRPEVINHETKPNWPAWAAVRASMSAPVFFSSFFFDGKIWADGGSGQYGINVMPAYWRCTEELKWRPQDFFLLSWGCGREKIGAIGTGKIDPVKWYFKYSSQESEIETNEWLADWQRDGLRQFRWNIDIPDSLTAMDATDHVDELIALVDR